MSTQTIQETKPKINVKEIEKGDIFSEVSHYVFLNREESVNTNGEIIGVNNFKHLESKEVVSLSDTYVSGLLETADQHDEKNIIEVGVEDKHWTQKQIDDAKKKGELEADSTVREGDLKLKGIRSIWTDIHSTQVFSVSFNKKGKDLTKKAFTAARDKQISDALGAISSGKQTLEDAFKSIQDNPITLTQKGEERTLRGYKVQFSSSNGFYDVIDMDIDDDGKGSNLRKVNINEINWLVISGIRYEVV